MLPQFLQNILLAAYLPVLTVQILHIIKVKLSFGIHGNAQGFLHIVCCFWHTLWTDRGLMEYCCLFVLALYLFPMLVLYFFLNGT